jgi:hypothetical protein
MKRFLGLISYAMWCVFVIHSFPRISWEMARASFEEMSDMKPGEAFEEEISRWGDYPHSANTKEEER